MDFDPEHNVLVPFNFCDRQVYARRCKQVPVGTGAVSGGNKWRKGIERR